MARDGWEVAASCLRPDESEMIAGLLESAGVAAIVEDAGAAGIFPLQGGFGGAEVLVPAADAARAREIITGSGVFSGAAGEGNGEEIPESEWSAPPPPASEPSEEAARAADMEARLREELWARLISPAALRLVSVLLTATLALLAIVTRCRAEPPAGPVSHEPPIPVQRPPFPRPALMRVQHAAPAYG